MKEITWYTKEENTEEENTINCDAYRTRVDRRYLNDFERGIYFARCGKEVEYIDETVSYCTGTKECDVCDCGGNRLKCSFYKDVREKAMKASKAELDKLELEFYRDYILRHDLLYDVMAEYEEWKKNHK